MINIAIIGTGYVGSVTGACLADFGNKVICVDNDPKKINSYNQGIIPIFEPGLDDVIKRSIHSGCLEFSTNISEAVKSSKVVFIAVGTPSLEDGNVNLSYVKSVSEIIASSMEHYTIIVNKSTVPIGTAKMVKSWIREKLNSLNKTVSFDVVSNPEFLREGNAIYDFTHPDRVVLGSDSPNALGVMKDVYHALYLNEIPFIETNQETAEIIKYASNAFLATKIAFINEIANLCEKTGANVQDVARAMGLDGRIGSKFLHPGPGYGGSCFPKDAHAIAKTAENFGEPLTIVETVIAANEKQKIRQAEKIEIAMGGKDSLNQKIISILGLSFKPKTDDIRESPSITIIKELVSKGAKVRVYDPAAMNNSKGQLECIKDSVYYAIDEYDTLTGSSALVILTEWNQFSTLDLCRIYNSLKNSPYFFDLRNIYKREEVEAAGLKYYGTGK